MKANLKIYNLNTKEKKSFNLPIDQQLIEQFLSNDNQEQSEYQIIGYSDNLNFLIEIGAQKYSFQNINDLVSLIDNSNLDERQASLKIIYHYKYFNENKGMKNLIDNFDYIQNFYNFMENSNLNNNKKEKEQHENK